VSALNTVNTVNPVNTVQKSAAAAPSRFMEA